ncbi:hypothetical protein BDN70DRAFT_901309 [Pholiota conissans]|uniref:Uncharacterized protein n=1 Tax=Pholiota conissans TaxID=109636 RepID=A0A9P5YPB8_9AGAR|nr:hypothetical protein BDN70DRAFT_901309 [Pholiota conissans]
MQFKFVFVAAAFAAASQAMAATITGFVGADCTGSTTNTVTGSAGECVTAGGGSVRSIKYSGVPNQIKFFISGGGHDNCSNGSQLTRGSGSGCANAPTGFSGLVIIYQNHTQHHYVLPQPDTVTLKDDFQVIGRISTYSRNFRAGPLNTNPAQ